MRLSQRGVALDLLEQPPVGLVGCAVGQHVKDEAFLDGLADAVQMEGLELAVRPRSPEEFQGARLGRSGKGKKRHVRQPPARLHLGQDPFLDLFVLGLGSGFFLFSLFQALGRQHCLEALGEGETSEELTVEALRSAGRSRQVTRARRRFYRMAVLEMNFVAAQVAQFLGVTTAVVVHAAAAFGPESQTSGGIS